MATNKTIAPTGVTVQIPGLTDAPDMSVPANAIDKAIDGINTLNSQFGVYTAPSGSSLKQLAFNDAVCPVNSVKWINLRNCSTSDLPNANAVYGFARVIKRVATVARVELYLDNGVTYIATATNSGSTWTDWQNPLPTYSSVTLASGITGNITIMRMGKLRVLTGYFNPNTSGANITIATLDAQDKPPVNIQGTFSGYGVTATGELNINSAGTFQCSVNAAPSNTLKFNIAYAVS